MSKFMDQIRSSEAFREKVLNVASFLVLVFIVIPTTSFLIWHFVGLPKGWESYFIFLCIAALFWFVVVRRKS